MLKNNKAFQNKLARSRASVNRGLRTFSNNNLTKMYTHTPPSSPRASSTENNAVVANNASPRSTNSPLSWGSVNIHSYRAQAEKEERDAREKQERIAAALARAKQGSPTGKANISWIKKPAGGTRRRRRNRKRSTQRNRR